MNKQVPNYLYHYTTINTLGYILKNRNIRFNNLTAMDDTDEGRFSDKNWGKYCFVSSWTSSEEESIEMWKMYSNNMNGVRIKLKTYPFKVYHAFETWNLSVIPPEELMNKSYIIMPLIQEKMLNEVQYIGIDELEDLKKEQILKSENNSINFDGGKLGKHKNIYWSFQKEWRYAFLAYPMAIADMMDDVKRSKAIFEFTNLVDLPFTDYFIELDEHAFSEMEILLGPRTNEIDRDVVEMLVNKYNPSAKVSVSCLSNRIK